VTCFWYVDTTSGLGHVATITRMRQRPSSGHERRPQLTHLDGRLLATFKEAAPLCGVSERTMRRWGAEYIASGGTRGVPVLQVSRRHTLVVVPKLLARLGLESTNGTSDPAPEDGTEMGLAADEGR
jgi:hypothetical protein